MAGLIYLDPLRKPGYGPGVPRYAVHFLESTLRGDVPSSFDHQLVHDEMLETLAGGGPEEDAVQRVAWVKHIADQIHTIDPNGPSFPAGNIISIGEVFEFTVEVGKWRSEHAGAKVDPIMPPA
ncbi:hypothetical protein KTQ42_06115|uniref:hypothetical protein n=1 Tax=Noviherbaspirillum sp. L7-7A TaxID=2850560 RepID=UPI001C2B8AB9|nr:hypothetical protein [Noviherbaspirillum sp. L7-7A]MBV0878881.1 hypothetical protein [Noviherbaspirillum sp. L7-7A]